MLYFTLYQLRQSRETAEGETDEEREQRRHNIDDLNDLSSRCEVLLAQCFRVASEFLYVMLLIADVHLLKELLQIDVMDMDGCHDLLSLLTDGFLETNVNSVAEAGLYKSSSVYVRLFSILFDGDPELRHYLISPESGCGEILKAVRMLHGFHV